MWILVRLKWWTWFGDIAIAYERKFGVDGGGGGGNDDGEYRFKFHCGVVVFVGGLL